MYCMPACNPLDVYGGKGLPRVFPVGGLVSGLTDTFQMATRQYFFPQLATARSGTWGWLTDAASVFGGIFANYPGTAQGNYIELGYISLQPGDYIVKGLASVAGDRGIGHLSIGGTDTTARLDCWGSTAKNQIVSDTFTVGPGGLSGTLRLTAGSKNDAEGATNYILALQQLEIVRLTGTGLGTSLDDLPWHGHCPPVCYSAANESVSITTHTSRMFGSEIGIGGAINNQIEWEVDVPQGDCTLVVVPTKYSNCGVASYYLDSVAPENKLGEISFYSGILGLNTVDTSITFTSATQGKRTLIARVEAAGAGGGYGQIYQWIQVRKTSAVGAITPTGTTYGAHTAELWPWFAESNSNFNSLDLSSANLHYAGQYTGSYGAPGPYLEHLNPGVLPGTYTLTDVCAGNSFYGIGSWTEGGGSVLATIDYKEPSLARNQRKTASLALTGDGAIRCAMLTSSSGSYACQKIFTRLLRTGD